MLANGELSARLLYIVHCGFVETRLLALAKKDRQLVELADALELVPGNVHEPDQDELGAIQASLKQYQDKYSPPMFDYAGLLSGEEQVPSSWATRSTA
jgi:hypothetical protein